MTPRAIVVIGASAGGITALMELASGLPGELPAALLVAVHSGPDSPGRFYVAPPDHDLLVDDDAVRVTRGPSENGFRPAVDALFRTAGRSAGARVVGIVLSGALDDGSYGLEQRAAETDAQARVIRELLMNGAEPGCKGPRKTTARPRGGAQARRRRRRMTPRDDRHGARDA